MKDIKISRFKNPLKINSVSRLTDNITTINGEDFFRTTEVYINEELLKNWLVLSNNQIAVTFPASTKIETVAVLTEELIVNQPNLTFFENGPILKSTSGMSKLIQNFIKLLVRSPDSNKFSTFGGGLLKIPGKTMTFDQNSVKIDVVNAINRTKNYLIELQNNNKAPLSEKLLDVQIVSINIDPDSNMSISVILKNKLGQESTFTV